MVTPARVEFGYPRLDKPSGWMQKGDLGSAGILGGWSKANRDAMGICLVLLFPKAEFSCVAGD